MQKTTSKIQKTPYKIQQKHPKITPHAPLRTTQHSQYLSHNDVQSAKTRHSGPKISVNTKTICISSNVYIDKYIDIPLSIPFVHIYFTAFSSIPN